MAYRRRFSQTEGFRWAASPGGDQQWFKTRRDAAQWLVATNERKKVQ